VGAWGVGAARQACTGCDALVICTSAVPQLDYLSLGPVLLRKLFAWAGAEQTKPEFYYAEGQMPEQVGAGERARGAGVRPGAALPRTVD